MQPVQEAVLRAALDPDAWSDVVATLAEALPGSKTHLLGYDTTLRRALPQAAAGYDETHLSTYRAYYHGVNPYIPGWAGLPVGRIVFSERVVPEGALTRTEYYADWLRPQDDLRNGHFAVVARETGRMFMLGTHFEGRAAERLMDPAFAVMQRIQPLVRHALDVNRMMLGLRVDSVVLRDGLEADGTGVVVMGAGGSILYANAVADALLAQGEVLRWDPRGRVTFADAPAALRLEAALRPAVRPAPASFTTGPSGTAYEVRLLPVTPEVFARLRLPFLLVSPPPALMLVLRPARQAADEAGLLMRRLGISRAEADVVLALTDGATVEEIAAGRRVSAHTVRTQIKAAMHKAEVRGRGALLRLAFEARRRL